MHITHSPLPLSASDGISGILVYCLYVVYLYEKVGQKWAIKLTFEFQSIKQNTVNPRYNDNICSQRRCHYNEIAVVKNL